MNRAKTFDLIILGGGCAALHFALAYQESISDKSVLILEKRRHYSHDRFWSFWLKEGEPYRFHHLVHHRWPQWCFSKEADIVTHEGGSYSYASIRSGAFYDEAIRAIASDERITLLTGQTLLDEAISKDGESYLIDSTAGLFRTPTIIDTRFQGGGGKDFQAQLYQVFLGVEVETKSPQFNPSHAELMSQMRGSNEVFQFYYQLPFSENRSLMELTWFTPKLCSPDILKTELNKWLDQSIRSSYTTVHQEEAILPMGELHFVNSTKRDSLNYHRVGAAHGSLKASSGYGFLRLQRWAQACVSKFSKNKSLHECFKMSKMNRILDIHFINCLKKNLAVAPELFLSLADAMPSGSFARFMNDEANIVDTIQLIRATPKLPMLRGLLS